MTKEQTISDTLAVFGEKSKESDNIKSLQRSLESILLDSLYKLASTGSLKEGDVKSIVKKTPANVGFDLGKGYGINLGVNTPSPTGDMIDDYRWTLSKTFEEGGKVDWDFISSKDIEGESEHLTGYVPSQSSGFTVGSVDIGQHSPEDLRTMLQSYANKLSGGVGEIRKDILDKITPYALKKGISDEDARKIGFDKEDIEYLTDAKRSSFEKKLSKKKDWNNLDTKTQTILGSIGWQYGTNSPQFKKLYKMRSDVSSIADELIAMGEEEYSYRRKKESDYLRGK